jgi:prolyl-tRNA editing enzyme YbaK/EbsC (Cys-tRNA(Pro) deacylase)
MTEKVLSASAQKFRDALSAGGFQCSVMELEKSTRSAAEAVQAVGCHIAQIVKSLVFKGKTTQKAYLVVASDANRVNEKKLSETVGEPVKMADADFVRKTSGFFIGGVPPVGHTMLMETLIDTDLLKHE